MPISGLDMPHADQPDLFADELRRCRCTDSTEKTRASAARGADAAAATERSGWPGSHPKAGSLLPRLVAQNRFGSLLFYGPPGCGKTSIAEAIARETNSRFVRVNAVMSNVAELRQILAIARQRPEAATILFIDELHRFNKSQQDLLLPDVEEGTVRLIGATTHNPGFYVNPPLLSRSHLFRLEPLATEAVVARAEAGAHRRGARTRTRGE